MSSRNLHSPKYIAQRRRKMVTLVFLLSLCVLTLLATLILCLRMSFLQIHTVKTEGSNTISNAEVQATALSSLSGNYFGIIPHSSSLFFSKNTIRTALAERFKGISDFLIRRSGLSEITVSLRERVPSAIVCAGFRDDTSSNDCYVADNRAFIFGIVSSSTPVLNHYYVPSEPITVGKAFVDENRFRELETFVKGALKAGLAPLGVLLGEKGEYEMYIKNRKNDSEVTVYFDDRSPFDSTLSNLLTFWDSNTNPQKATSTPAFDYINLRFGNTVYYSRQ